MSSKAKELLKAARNKKTEQILLVNKNESSVVKEEPSQTSAEEIRKPLIESNIIDGNKDKEVKSEEKVVKAAIEHDKLNNVLKKRSIFENNEKYAIFTKSETANPGKLLPGRGPNAFVTKKFENKEMKVMGMVPAQKPIEPSTNAISNDEEGNSNNETAKEEQGDDNNIASSNNPQENMKKMIKLQSAKKIIRQATAEKELNMKPNMSMRIMDMAGMLGNVIGRHAPNQESNPLHAHQKFKLADSDIQKLEEDENDKEDNENSNIVGNSSPKDGSKKEEESNHNNFASFSSVLTADEFSKGGLTQILIEKPVREVRKKKKADFII